MTVFAKCGALVTASLVVLALGACDPKNTSPEDTIPPEAEITSPASGSEVSGLSFLLQVVADDDAIAMEVRAGDEDPYTITGPPWNTLVLTVPYGDDEIVPVAIEAFDAAGNSTVDEITVSIRPREVTAITSSTDNESNPTWSPDGTMIAYSRGGTSGTADIWMMNADGTGQQALFFDTNNQDDLNPAWSPDGTTIAWQSFRNAKFDVWWMNIAVGISSAENLTFPNENNVEPAWSPDGSWIYFATDRAGFYDTWRLDTASLAQNPVTSFQANDREPVPNYDDEFLAFSSDLNLTTAHIYVKAFGSLNARLLTGEAGVTEEDPHLSPLGNIILYTRISGPLSNIWAIYDDRGNAVQVTTDSSTLGAGGGVWGPFGQRIAYHSGEAGNLDIYIIQ